MVLIGTLVLATLALTWNQDNDYTRGTYGIRRLKIQNWRLTLDRGTHAFFIKYETYNNI